MNFYRWMIKKHINDHAPVGDLARDMKGDKQFPHDGDKAKIQEYLDGCGACKDPQVLVEQRLDFSKWIPEGFGTGDCLIVADDVLHIIDFKYGLGVLVEAEDNPQMMCYALGAFL